MIRTIARNELRRGLRNKSFIISWLILIALMITAALEGFHIYRENVRQRADAEQEQRKAWLHQDPKHPHIAAHFGNFAFMPKNGLSFFDPGLDAYTGTVVYLEPHRQNDFAFKPAEEQNSALRFGELSLAMILQVILPLIIIFNGFGSFTREKEDGTYKLILSQGCSFRQLFWGKFTGQGLIASLLFAPVVLLLCGIETLFDGHLNSDAWLRSLLLISCYLAYLLLFVGLSLIVSAFSHTSKASVLTLLCIWMVVVILLPKWAANAGDNGHPLPSKYEFLNSIHYDIDQGVNGHDPKGGRAEALKKQLLTRYHVDTVSKLPFNFEGFIMQAGEDYSSQVYDKHFAALQNTLTLQNRISLQASLFDPYLAVKNLSMALCNSDFYAHLNFQKQAEAYRRYFVQYMNRNMEYHSSLGDWNYKVNQNEYAKIRRFDYRQPTVNQSLTPYLSGLVSIAIWMAAILFLSEVLHRKATRPL